MQRRQRILVVEDEIHILEVYREFLGLKHDTTLTDNVSDAYEAMSNALEEGPRYDVVVVDRKLNGDDGDALVKKMRKIGYDKPVIMVSGSEMPEDAYELDGKDEVPRGKGYMFLRKPIRFAYLGKVIDQMV